MTNIFSAPSSLKLPSLDFKNMGNYHKECDEYEASLKQILLNRNPNGKNVGEIIKFPVADGYARYMVANMKPLELVHIPLDDAYQFQYVNLMGEKEVQENINQDKAMRKLFSK